MHPRTLLIMAALLFVLLLTGTSEACPTCKEALAENGGNMVRGYFWSIMFMMSMPFLIVGGLGSMFYMEVRKARLRQATDGAREFATPEPATAGV